MDTMLTNASRFRRLIIAGVALSLLSLVAAACGGDAPTATSAPPTQSGPGATTAQPTAAPTAMAPTAAPTFDAEAYFKGKTITMQVGFGQGGGTDRQARYFAEHWGKYIPGNPKIEVQNITPVLSERNRLWRSKPDGFTLATEATSGIADMNEDAAEYDMRKVSAVGSTSGGDSFWIIWKTLSYDCADSAMGKNSPVIKLADKIPTAGDLTGNAFAAGMAARALGLPLQLIHVAGDTGSAAQKLMLERGDTNSWLTATVWHQLPRTNPGWVAEGTVKPFLDVSVEGVRIGPNDEGDFSCGKLEDYAEGGANNPNVRDFYTFNDPERAFAKNIIGPPGMDPNVLGALRKALDDAMNDPDFADNLEKTSGIPNQYTPGAQFEADLKRLTDAFFAELDRFETLQQELYNAYVR